jgi:hypothetical protein
MATITSTGAWTPLPFDLNASLKTGPNDRRIEKLNLTPIANFDHPEVLQMIQLLADGYGVHFQAGALLLRHLLVAVLQRNAPQVEKTYNP